MSLSTAEIAHCALRVNNGPCAQPNCSNCRFPLMKHFHHWTLVTFVMKEKEGRNRLRTGGRAVKQHTYTVNCVWWICSQDSVYLELFCCTKQEGRRRNATNTRYAEPCMQIVVSFTRISPSTARRRDPLAARDAKSHVQRRATGFNTGNRGKLSSTQATPVWVLLSFSLFPVLNPAPACTLAICFHCHNIHIYSSWISFGGSATANELEQIPSFGHNPFLYERAGGPSPKNCERVFNWENLRGKRRAAH